MSDRLAEETAAEWEAFKGAEFSHFEEMKRILDVEEPNSGLFIKGELVKEEIKYKMIPEWKENTCTFFVY